MGDRLNILWLMSDQHHAGCMGAAGHRDVRTPNLDVIAQRGVRFTRAYCNNPICGPSRVSMITGQYIRTTGITGNELFDADLPNPGTLPTLLRQQGYQTAMIGKGHTLRRWDQDGYEWIRYCDLCDADRANPRTCHYFDHLVRHGLADLYDLGYRPPGQPGAGWAPFISALPYQHSVEHWTGDESLAFLQGRDTTRPFFLKVSFQRPHNPLSPCREHAAMYDPVRLTLPDSIRDLFERRFDGKPAFQRRHIATHVSTGYPYVPRDTDDLRLNLAYYLTLVTVIDEQIGRILEHLRSSGELDNTIIVYLSDHGDFAADHGLMFKNLGIYESIHRVPLLLSYPGGPRGVVRNALVELVDVYPTLCDLIGLPTPPHVEGRSLLPTVGLDRGREMVFCEWDFTSHPEQRQVAAVRDERHRLVVYDALPDGELYDHALDPEELINRWSDPAYLAVRQRLQQALAEHRGQAQRRWGLEEDRRAQDAARGLPTWRIHRQGEAWSRVMG
jgi:arylsulfatase A-like enzyme